MAKKTANGGRVTWEATRAEEVNAGGVLRREYFVALRTRRDGKADLLMRQVSVFAPVQSWETKPRRHDYGWKLARRALGPDEIRKARDFYKQRGYA